MKAYVFCIVLYTVIFACMCATFYNFGTYFKLIEDENVKNSITSVAALVWLYLLGSQIPSIYKALKE